MLNADRGTTVGRAVAVRGAPVKRESLRTVARAALGLIEAQLARQAEAGVDLDAPAVRIALRLRAALELPV